MLKIIMDQSPPSNTYNTKGICLLFLQGKAEFGEVYPNPVKWCSSHIKIAKEGDVLISVRAPVGDVNIVPFECCIGRGLAALRPKDGLKSHYLFYYLLTVKDRLKSEGRGTTFKAIGKSVLENFQTPLPPLPEQQEIAHILNTVDKKLKLRKKGKSHSKNFSKTMLRKLIIGEIRLKDLNLKLGEKNEFI